jgi:hypothetical protein
MHSTPTYTARPLRDPDQDGQPQVSLECPYCQARFARPRDVVDDYTGCSVPCPGCAMPSRYPAPPPEQPAAHVEPVDATCPGVRVPS